MVNVGIIGCGFVGGALKAWLEENNKDVKIFVSDPPKGFNDDLSGIDIAFLQIHVPTEDDGTHYLFQKIKLIEAAATFRLIERLIHNQVSSGCGDFATLIQI